MKKRPGPFKKNFLALGFEAMILTCSRVPIFENLLDN